MQKLATKVFIYASILFGILGIVLIVTLPGRNTPDDLFHTVLTRLLFVDVFVLLPAFALSVAGKYLKK